MTFDQWMKRVDDLVWRQAGCSVLDLPDCNLQDWYEDGLTPEQAARLAVMSIEQRLDLERQYRDQESTQARLGGRLKFTGCPECGSDFGMRSMEREIVAMLCPDAIASLGPWYEEPNNDLVLYYPCFVCNYLGERIPDAWEKLEAEEDVLEWCKQPDPMAPDYEALAAEPEASPAGQDSRDSAGLEG